MSHGADPLADELLNLLPSSEMRIEPVTCVSTSPFQVVIAGLPTWVPAKRIAGQTFGLGDKGMAFWSPPLAPICFRTA
jgi:hypothetical protein